MEHRFEHFNSYKGIDFINDSKSTNIDSAIKALESISKKVILILGGIPKEDDFSEISLFKKKILKIMKSQLKMQKIHKKNLKRLKEKFQRRLIRK